LSYFYLQTHHKEKPNCLPKDSSKRLFEDPLPTKDLQKDQPDSSQNFEPSSLTQGSQPDQALITRKRQSVPFNLEEILKKSKQVAQVKVEDASSEMEVMCSSVALQPTPHQPQVLKGL